MNVRSTIIKLKGYETILGDTSDRDKYLRMREGMNSYLKKTMLVFTGILYEQFAASVARIDPSSMTARKGIQAKEGQKSRPRIRPLRSAKAATQALLSNPRALDIIPLLAQNILRPSESLMSWN